jgi:hypothetical protein
MRAQKVLAKDFQFYLSDLDNIVLVECHEDETVTVRATKNNCSQERQISFIRKLAAEGFLPDEHQWFSGATDGSNGVRWIKDLSWLKTRPPARKQANRFMKRLLVAACVLWIAMMRILVVSHYQEATAKTPAEKVRAHAAASPQNAKTIAESPVR